jgi:uncharacterized membrane protein required for colicin V production
MRPELQAAAGSPVWQVIFISFAAVLILFEVLRGWRRGLARQLARLGALMAAYFTAFFSGKMIVPIARPLIKMPDIALSIIGGALLAILVYTIITSLGCMLFRRTGQHHSAVVRFVYGSTGAILGFFFGAFLVWLIVVGVRSLGAVADAQVASSKTAPASAQPTNLRAVDIRRRSLPKPSGETPNLMASLAKLKNSLELGAVGDVVKKADAVPTKTYEMLGKAGKVFSNPESAQKFLTFPGARELSEQPKIVALRDDPEISEMIAQGRFVDLLQNDRVLSAANDPALIEQIKKFDLNAALDYALPK